MKNRTRTLKLIFDVVLLAFLALMYKKMAVSMQFHELGGLALGCLFIVHKVLNMKWIRSVTAGIFRGKVRLNSLWIVDLLLLIAMTAVLVTGLFISKTLPTALKNGFRLQVWHYFAAAMSLALTGIHLGLHWPLIKAAVWSKIPLGGKVRTAVGILLLCAMLGYGGYSFMNTSTLSWFTRPFTVRTAMSGPGGGQRGMGKGGQRFDLGSMPRAQTDGTEQVPGTGQRDQQPEAGKQRQGGQGQRNGGRGGMKAPGGAGVLSTILTFSSIVLLFAGVTGCLKSLVGCIRRRTGAKQAGKA